ncbi:hypothetical protein PAXRUDRAFT_177607, partial [Paxillus rubicundulus Ve08.2h10]
HSHQYPVLLQIAHDYLAIQGSSTAYEHAFSQGGLTVTVMHNRLSPKTVEALQILILKNRYSSGSMSAAIEALEWEDKPWTPL